VCLAKDGDLDPMEFKRLATEQLPLRLCELVNPGEADIAEAAPGEDEHAFGTVRASLRLRKGRKGHGVASFAEALAPSHCAKREVFDL
jgi:hypothetical protein